MKDDSSDEDLQGDLDGDLSDPVLQTEADVTCPYCGELVSITLDPESGAAQEYIEDCQVCCRPWRVHVSYDDEMGTAEVSIEQAQ